MTTTNTIATLTATVRELRLVTIPAAKTAVARGQGTKHAVRDLEKALATAGRALSRLQSAEQNAREAAMARG